MGFHLVQAGKAEMADGRWEGVRSSLFRALEIHVTEDSK
jgi:hypothetical protein